MKKADRIEHLSAIRRRCRGPLSPDDREKVNSLLAAGKRDEASLLDRARRKPCGYDVNKLIAGEPFDGKTHAAACPKCGTHIHWTAPEL